MLKIKIKIIMRGGPKEGEQTKMGEAMFWREILEIEITGEAFLVEAFMIHGGSIQNFFGISQLANII